MSEVCKQFGATKALKGVDLQVHQGEVHALIGENGAGKSTLMKILSGAYTPDSGSIELDSLPFKPRNPLHARQCGIAMIYQELTLAPHLSVEENITLGAQPARWGWLNRGQRTRTAHHALQELHHDTIPLNVPAGGLTIGEQQVVEIARALVGSPRVLIMDEPTSSLTQVDTQNLFKVIKRLKSLGVSIIYISHFLEECQEVCDRYTVLRDGESVGQGSMETARIPEIIRMMVGRDISEIYPRQEQDHEMGTCVLSVEHLKGKKKPNDVNFQLREGEILGIAGLVGSGRTESLRCLFGLDKMEAGKVVVYGHESPVAAPCKRLAEGMGLLSEDRKEEGLLLNRSIADNMTLTRFTDFTKLGFIFQGKQDRMTSEWIQRLEIKTLGARQMAGELSGGNQQKVAIGRLLHHEASIFLLDEPTRGIDVGSKSQIYRLMLELAQKKVGIIFVSSYIPELMGICDTIAVMCRGKLSEIKPVAEWSKQDIIAAAIGQTLTPKTQV